MITKLNTSLNNIEALYMQCKFDEAYIQSMQILESVESIVNEEERCTGLIQVAMKLIDIGHASNNELSSLAGLQIFEENKDSFLGLITLNSYLYCLANAKRNVIQHRTNDSFQSSINEIEQLAEVSSILWKAILASKKENNEAPPEYLVNVANIHKQQNRISEALRLYDEVNKLNLDIAQSWINRSECLILINQITNSSSIKMGHEIVKGYQTASQSKSIPPDFAKYYRHQANRHHQYITELCVEKGLSTEDEEHIDFQEFEAMSDYRKWSLKNYLSLTEHGLYCKCVGAERDNLTIPTGGGSYGDFLPAMEMVLNRLKSEFGFARRLYYEFLTDDLDIDIEHESCFSELYDGEVLGYNVEKLRTAFRVCFGILDKIANAIASLFDFRPPKGHVNFQSFWQLHKPDRMQKFEEIHNHGLIALYSIACDLNFQKEGELSFYKKWRNAMEHKFVVIYEGEKPQDNFNTHQFFDEILFLEKSDFQYSLEHVFQLTRSAIFSFVFAVREKGNREKPSHEPIGTIFLDRKDFKDIN